jgi:DNA polymerase-1
MKSNYLEILNSLNKDSVKPKLSIDSNVLIIDAMNLFMRSFCVINHVNIHGNHIGGLTGFLKGLGSYIRMHNPTRVIIVFDGEGNSNTKKMLLNSYKDNRTDLKMIKKNLFSNKEEELTSISNQLDHLIYYLNLLPVTLLSVDKIEADDVISYIAQHLKPKADIVTIVSVDNDFYQLVDDKITVYNPLLKKHFYRQQVKEKYNVYPGNYLLYKTLMGDKSDNVTKIKGLGEKKIQKMFSFLQEDKKYQLEDIFNHCEENKHTHDIYQKLLLYKETIKINKEVMDLQYPKITDLDLEYIHDNLAVKPKKFDTINFKKSYHEDNLNDSIKNVDMWLKDTFNQLYTFTF